MAVHLSDNGLKDQAEVMEEVLGIFGVAEDGGGIVGNADRHQGPWN